MKFKPFCFAFVTLALVLLVSAPAFSTGHEAQEAAPATTHKVPTPPAQSAEPAAAPAEEQASATVAQTNIQIKDTAVCQDVVDRAPVGSGDVFAKESARLYCFTRITGAEGETQITHNWYYKGTLKASVKLPVRSGNWRTWSSKTMVPEWTGEWMVEVLSEEGTPLESIIFFMQ